jgi:hypothetical protein
MLILQAHRRTPLLSLTAAEFRVAAFVSAPDARAIRQSVQPARLFRTANLFPAHRSLHTQNRQQRQPEKESRQRLHGAQAGAVLAERRERQACVAFAPVRRPLRYAERFRPAPNSAIGAGAGQRRTVLLFLRLLNPSLAAVGCPERKESSQPSSPE